MHAACAGAGTVARISSPRGPSGPAPLDAEQEARQAPRDQPVEAADEAIETLDAGIDVGETAAEAGADDAAPVITGTLRVQAFLEAVSLVTDLDEVDGETAAKLINEAFGEPVHPKGTKTVSSLSGPDAASSPVAPTTTQWQPPTLPAN